MLSIFVSMRFIICVLTFSFFIFGCKAPQERIIGTFDIDLERGCASCQEQGPELMVFEDWNINDGSPGHYRFEYQNGAAHSGTYDFLQIDTLLKLTISPDSASFEYFGIIGTSYQTEYKISSNKIREKCPGLFKNCIWIRR